MSQAARELSLNWLALGLLLAAWNAVDDGSTSGEKPLARPAALRGYAHVSVRAVARAAVVKRGFTVM
jgi:hypothetical protein